MQKSDIGNHGTTGTRRHLVLGVRFLTPSAFVVRLERRNFQFAAGQHLLAGRGLSMREYSIYSGERDPYLEILVKLIERGTVSPMLASLGPGDRIEIEGPFGAFTLPEPGRFGRNYLFVGTGTGIAPYRSFVRSSAGLEYRVLHGVRHREERYAREEFEPGRYTDCLSRDTGGGFSGRVTSLLETVPLDPRTECYLCGNSDMIYDCFAILSGRSVPRERIHAEVYF